MCGRYSNYAPHSRVTRQLRIDVDEVGDQGARYNIPPGTQQPVAMTVEGRRALTQLLWGFRPSWADEGKPAPINARAESVARSSYFRSAFANRRCLIPSSGWFEWQKTEHGKVPYFIHTADDDLLCYAGIYEPATETRPASFAIITHGAKGELASVHDRMPLVLAPSCWDDWLDPSLTRREDIKAATRSIDIGELAMHPVSTRVNTPKNDDASLVQAIAS
ncbi:SOS response-associated peptidase [Aquisalimonas asiatica]|uniref:Abasic site processing protein n=1 Tax=Aquisalimonas asiatica TaxID=406100 RepID=A0A1H8S4T3_9GAMM|nr:SOS response-associated peptidase [Aquisalimonas asiatica]SEO73173.1 Putative SOS response-associated peptidase YedK [Aquisalimonas asiatica]